MKKVKLKACLNTNVVEAGCDEAGRGCLAGPVFAAAVILPPDFTHDELNDSKQITQKKRLEIRQVVEENALAWAVASVDHHEVDRLNIYKAAMKAMHLAINKLNVVPQHLIIDGNRFIPYPEISHTCVVKGDGKYASIAAASILAKTYRDEYMEKIHQEYPQYNWCRNMGYATKDHKLALKEFGATPYHRRSFNLIDNQIKINFDNL
jgi:ribonuclease HII